MEYARNETHQFCDTELCVVLDKRDGKLQRAFKGNASYGTFGEALEILTDPHSCWVDRRIIVPQDYCEVVVRPGISNRESGYRDLRSIRT